MHIIDVYLADAEVESTKKGVLSMNSIWIAVPFLLAGLIFFWIIYLVDQNNKKKSNKDIDEYDY